MAESVDSGNASSLSAFLEETLKTYEDTQREIKEIDVLVKQSAAEVERLAQRNTQVVSFVKQLQTNFETVPREDIREAYEAVQNTQQRLFTMRGQLEKLQSDQRNLERLANYLRRILQFGDSLGSLSPRRNGRTGGPEQVNIVRIIRTQESERQSLVRRMHDGPASSLSNFILQAEICERYFDIDPDRARTELHTLKDAAATTFSTVKDFIFDLRPMMLDDLGVVPTLRRYTESLQEKGGIPISMVVTGMERRLESHIEVTIFRGVQELINNARAHSRATQIQVLLDLDETKVTAVVEDNGQGFDVDEIANNTARETIGLPTLRERVDLLGGSLKLQSGRGRGTRAEIAIPVHAGEPA